MAALAGGEAGGAAGGHLERLATEPVLQAMRAGASDILPRNAEGKEIAAILSRLINNAVVAQGLPARLTLVLGADREAAAIAATDMALAISRHRQPALLIDCALPNSAAETYLDLKVNYGIASAVADRLMKSTSVLPAMRPWNVRRGSTTMSSWSMPKAPAPLEASRPTIVQGVF